MESPLREDLLFIFLGIHSSASRNSDNLKELSCVAILDNNSNKCKLVRIFFGQITVQWWLRFACLCVCHVFLKRYQLPFSLAAFWTIFPYKIWQKCDKFDHINVKFKNLSVVTATVFWWFLFNISQKKLYPRNRSISPPHTHYH